MLGNEVYCAEAALSAGEPLAGTAAANIEHWIVLEQAEPWGPKGVEDSLPAETLSYLKALGKAHPSLRVQLIRRPDRTPVSPVLYLAHAPEHGGQLLQVPLTRFEGLPELDLARWLSHGVAPNAAEACPEPLYLVCVHGRRDRCCARFGMPVYTALRQEAGDRVWQTTHLGGHRFAATLLVLPHGVCYGRVAPGEASALVAAHARGEIYDLSRVRGRPCYAPAVQAAEVELRKRLGERRLGALTLKNAREDDGLHRVTFASEGGAEHTVDLIREALPPAPASCGATPKPGEALVPLKFG